MGKILSSCENFYGIHFSFFCVRRSKDILKVAGSQWIEAAEDRSLRSRGGGGGGWALTIRWHMPTFCLHHSHLSRHHQLTDLTTAINNKYWYSLALVAWGEVGGGRLCATPHSTPDHSPLLLKQTNTHLQ